MFDALSVESSRNIKEWREILRERRQSAEAPENFGKAINLSTQPMKSHKILINIDNLSLLLTSFSEF